MCENRSHRFYSSMANLVTNLNSEEGGDVGLETLLQTYVVLSRKTLSFPHENFGSICTEVNAWRVKSQLVILNSSNLYDVM